MAGYEYTVIPAPTKGTKAKGVKTAEARFANALQDTMNQMGADSWEYQRAETLPSIERSGLTGSTTQWRHVLVFRRARKDAQPAQDTAPHEEPLKITHDETVRTQPAVTAPAGIAPVVALAATVSQDDAQVEETPPTPLEEPKADVEPIVDEDAHDPDHPAGQPGATVMLKDNGVEETSEVSGLTQSLTTLAKSRKTPFDSDR